MKFLRYLLNLFNPKRHIGKRNTIRPKAVIGKHTRVTGAVISNSSRIGRHCKIHFARLEGQIEIGDYTSLWGPEISLYAEINPIKIGNFCSIAHGVTMQEYDHDYTKFSTYFIEKNLLKSGKHHQEVVSKGPIVIDHDVWVGANCTILSGAHISTGAVIAANSVVKGSIPPYAIAAGSPAKVIKYRFPEETRAKLLATKWWHWEDEKLKANVEKLNDLASR